MAIIIINKYIWISMINWNQQIKKRNKILEKLLIQIQGSTFIHSFQSIDDDDDESYENGMVFFQE